MADIFWEIFLDFNDFYRLRTEAFLFINYYKLAEIFKNELLKIVAIHIKNFDYVSHSILLIAIESLCFLSVSQIFNSILFP